MVDGQSQETHLTFKDFQARILVDGKEVPHYGIEANKEKKEVSCWIASQAGQPFTVKYAKEFPTSCGLKVTLNVDGFHLGSYGTLEGYKVVKEIKGVQVSATELQQLVFASLELTDDEAYLESSSLRKTGEIKLDIFEAKLIRSNMPLTTNFTLPTGDKVHERSKKGMNHQVKLGAKLEVPRSTTSLTSVDVNKIITFVFKYRALDILQATGIAPRAPTAPPPHPLQREHRPTPRTPSSSSSKRKLSDMKQETIEVQDDSDDEERRLLERLEQVRRKKLAKKTSDSSSNKRLKQEPKTSFVPGEVIDLT